MMVEGKGLVAPAPIGIAVSREEVELIAKDARDRDAFRGYGTRVDGWGRGFARGASPTLIGMVGERAFAKHARSRGFPVPVDTALHRRGDGGVDFMVEGLRVQMKTRLTSRTNLIRRRDHRGVERALTCHVYVFARWARDEQRVDLLGWINVRDLRRGSVSTIRIGHGGEHDNYAIDDRHLQPLCRLFDDALARREMRSSA